MKPVMAWMILAILLASNVAHAADAPEWQSLFDGKSLNGWKAVNGAAGYEVSRWRHRRHDQGRHAEQLPRHRQNPMATSSWSSKPSRPSGPTNSGVQFRSQSKPEVMQGRVHGPQMDLDPSERQWTGGLYDEAMTGWWYPGTLNPQPGLYKFNEWNQVRIEAIGPIDAHLGQRRAVGVCARCHLPGWLHRPPGAFDRQARRRRPQDSSGAICGSRNTLRASPAEANIFVRNTLPNDLSEVERKQGWRLLWDGKSAAGLAQRQGRRVPDARLADERWRADRHRRWRRRHRHAKKALRAFELQLEFKLTPGANSGIKYYVGDYGKGDSLGLEYQLLDDERHRRRQARRGRQSHAGVAVRYPTTRRTHGQRRHRSQSRRLAACPHRRASRWQRSSTGSTACRC